MPPDTDGVVSPARGGRLQRRRAARRVGRRGRLDGVIARLPARVAARIDLLRPSLVRSFGGPLNGQKVRQRVVREMFTACGFDLVVETGTYRATTTAFLARITTAPIVTFESNERFFRYSWLRMRREPGVRVIQRDSATGVRELAQAQRQPKADRPFFYLDAHWAERLPLRWELLEVLSGWPSFCVLIDDFQVPDDAGYRFDDYGHGFRLTTEIFEGLDLADVAGYWPAEPSGDETGRCRGWIVLCRGAGLQAALGTVRGLREAVLTGA